MNSAKPKIHFYIDVVGTCILRCPSCPVGNSPEVVNSRGLMEPAVLDRILAKAAFETVVTNVGLFNWTEPLLHPRLDEMVQTVKKHGMPCAVSTNLNICNLDRYRNLLKAGPNVLRISLSGFTQEKYGITHRGGSIEKVKQNLDALLRIKHESNSATRFALAFHRYFSNLDEEYVIRRYCEERGFVFLPVNALMLPLEKILAYCGDTSFSTINESDEALIANLTLPLKQALSVASRAESDSCKLLEQQVVLNWKGDALLCCAVYDEKKFLVGNYLEDSLESIQSRRRRHEACRACCMHGASNYFQYNIPGMEQLVAENILRHACQ